MDQLVTAILSTGSSNVTVVMRHFFSLLGELNKLPSPTFDRLPDLKSAFFVIAAHGRD